MAIGGIVSNFILQDRDAREGLREKEKERGVESQVECEGIKGDERRM